MPHYFLLRFGHLKKLPPLPVFMDWLHTGKDLHQACWLEILGASKSFLGMCLLWGCACNFPIREFSQFLFPELVTSFSLWHLSVGSLALQQAAELSFVLSGPRCAKYASQVRQASPLGSFSKSQNVGHVLHSSITFLTEKSWVWRLLPIVLRDTCGNGYCEWSEAASLPISMQLFSALCLPGLLQLRNWFLES